MAPVTDAIQTRYGDRVQVTILTKGEDTFKPMVEAWDIKGTPTYVFVSRESEEIGRIVGVAPLERFDAILAEAGIEPVASR